MLSTFPRVLYFISGPTATQDQLRDAAQYGPGVSFRNALMIVADAPIENADAVAGDVPQRYKDALPNVKDRDAVYARMDARISGVVQQVGGASPKAVPYDALTIEQKNALNANDLARGAQPPTVNERLKPVAPPLPNEGWSTGAPASTAGASGEPGPVEGAGPIEPAGAHPAPAADDQANKAAKAAAEKAKA